MAGCCKTKSDDVQKANLIVAMAIGALISAVLLVLEPLTDYSLLSLELPGITVAYFSGEREEVAPRGASPLHGPSMLSLVGLVLSPF